MTTASPLVPMLSEKLDTVITHQPHHPLQHRAPPPPLTLNHLNHPSTSGTSGQAQASSQQGGEARHPGQQQQQHGSQSQPPSTAGSSVSSSSADSLQHQQQHQQHQQQQQLHEHHPASTTSALNGFYQAIQQRHSSGDLSGKSLGEAETTNPTAVSLFSPWSNFTGAGTSNYPFPSPSLGFTLGDTFVPWTDAMLPSGLTPTLNGTMMDQHIPHLSQLGHNNNTHTGTGFRGDEHPGFFKHDYMVGGNHNGMMGFSVTPMDDRRQGSGSGSSGDIHRKESNSAAGVPGSVSRGDSSSSGASMASAQMDGNVRTPTPLFKTGGNNEPAGLPQSHSFEPSASYFTYPRPGGGDPNLLSSSYQSSSSNAGEGSSRAPPMQPQHLFHLNQPYQPAFAQHNQYMSVPPALTQHPSQHHQQQQHQQHQFPPHHAGFLSTDRQNSRASTSSEFSSISPAMLNSRAPRASSPVSMFSDDALHPISAQTSPHSQPQSLPIHPGMQHANLKRGSASSMMTDADDLDGDDLDGDEADGVEKNGMMWGMPTAAYRSLSARERKRVRNRISARTFRARRKEHLSVLEQDLSDRNALLKASQDEIKQLRNENAEREFGGRNV